MLRSLCAQKMLPIFNSDKIVVNIDETNLVEGDLRRRKWRIRGMTHSVVEKSISNKLNIIGAIDTNGSVYCSILHENTNTDVFCLFMEKLISRIEKESPNFRNTHIFQMDGASMHKSEETRNYLASLRIKIVISSPYSYQQSPVELLWVSII